jgi:hypothetical protein
VSGTSGKTKLVLTSRWIPEKGDAGQIYTSAAFWVTPNIGLGADYRPLVDEINFTATWRAIGEDPNGWRPAVILGSSVDDFTIGNDEEIESRSVFGTISKALPRFDNLNLTVSPYAGATYIHELEDLRPVGGVVLRHDFMTAIIQYSGTDTHLTLSKNITDRVSASFILWGLEMPGLGLRVAF